MSLSVVKRDGRVVDFDKIRIVKAISAAACEVNPGHDLQMVNLAREKTDEVINRLNQIYSDRESVTVEEIQDIVEDKLMDGEHNNIAKAYILYRDKRARVRHMKSGTMNMMRELTKTEAEDSDIKRENGNIDGNTAMGLMLKYGSEISKEYAFAEMISPEFARAHKEGWIHLHDADFINMGTLTCCQLPLHKKFEQGFSTGHGYLRPPKSIRAASAQACIAIQANQNDQHGGQSVPLWDVIMAKYVNISFRKHLIHNIYKAHRFLRSWTNYTEDDVKRFVDSEIENGAPLNVYIDESHISSKYTNPIQNIMLSLHARLEFSPVSKLTDTVDKILRLTIEDTKEETHQAMEAAIHNLNTLHSRAGAQVSL